MLNSPRSCLFLAPALLAACGGVDLTPMLGTYHGEIVADNVVDTNYAVTVSAVDGDTISVSGADFTTFEVDIMDVGGMLTNLPDDPENTLSFSGGSLSLAHAGADGEVTFNGSLDGTGGGDDGGGDNGGGDTGGDNGGGDTGGDNGGGDTGGDADSAGALAEGDYRGAMSGPVVSANYLLTITMIDAGSVEARGQGITSFTIPLHLSGGDVEEAGTWTEGTFLLDGDDLSLTYDPQGIVFTGTRE